MSRLNSLTVINSNTKQMMVQKSVASQQEMRGFVGTKFCAIYQ